RPLSSASGASPAPKRPPNQLSQSWRGPQRGCPATAVTAPGRWRSAGGLLALILPAGQSGATPATGTVNCPHAGARAAVCAARAEPDAGAGAGRSIDWRGLRSATPSDPLTLGRAASFSGDVNAPLAHSPLRNCRPRWD